MTRSEIDALLEKHRAAFNSRDVDRLAACHTEQGTFRSPAAGLVTGRTKIAGVYEYWLDAFPDMEFSWREPLVEGEERKATLVFEKAGSVEIVFKVVSIADTMKMGDHKMN